MFTQYKEMFTKTLTLRSLEGGAQDSAEAMLRQQEGEDVQQRLAKLSGMSDVPAMEAVLKSIPEEARKDEADLVTSVLAKMAMKGLAESGKELETQLDGSGDTRIVSDTDGGGIRDLFDTNAILRVPSSMIKIAETYGITPDQVITAAKDLKMTTAQEDAVHVAQSQAAQKQSIQAAGEFGGTNSANELALDNRERRGEIATAELGDAREAQQNEIAMQNRENRGDAAITEAVERGNTEEIATLYTKEGITSTNATEIQNFANALPDATKKTILEKAGGGTNFLVDGKIGRQMHALNQYMANQVIPKETMTALLGKEELSIDGIDGPNTQKVLAHLRGTDDNVRRQYARNWNQDVA